MTKFKVITIKKRGGGTRKQRVQVMSSGKFKFVKNKTTRKAPKKRSKSKAPKRKAPKRKSNKAPKRSKTVVKRSLTSKIPFVNNPTIRKVATGIGLATIGVGVISLVAPQIANNPIVKPALAFLGGGIPGVIGQVVVSGGIGGLSNILGGSTPGGNSQTVNSAGNGGFA